MEGGGEVKNVFEGGLKSKDRIHLEGRE